MAPCMLAFVSSAEGPSGCCGGGAVAVAELLLVPSPGPVPAFGASNSPACFSSGVSPPEACTTRNVPASSGAGQPLELASSARHTWGA